jgi:hypothetical protein
MTIKNFLLIAGDNYYPESGTDDWIAAFETHEEAKAEVVTEPSCDPSVTERWWGAHLIRGCHYDWYEIVDINKWISEN